MKLSYQTKRFLCSLLEIGVYMGAVILITDSARRERLKDLFDGWRQRVRFKADVISTLDQIRSLPEE